MADRQFLSVGHLPERKRPCLYVEDGAVVRLLGYFQSDEAMREFLSFDPRFITKPASGPGAGE